MGDLIILWVTLFIGFAGGYGLRDYISRRRRKAARKKFHDENPEYGENP
jgi:hypothetical protein